MITYLINFILCSGVLLLVYRLFLRNENLYRFNRFYLLFSLVFSLIVPFITIQVPGKIMNYERGFVSKAVPQQTIAPVPQHISTLPIRRETYMPVSSQSETQIIPAEIVEPGSQQTASAGTHHYLPDALITLYLLAAAILLVRFIRNSYRISRSVSQSTVVNYHDTKLVLIDEDVTPHSFLKYIFINKKDYREGAIEPEIICHEQTHVKQLHSLDIIFVELLQVICWFNPLIPFYRKAIQLNHEFLADEAVIKNYHDTPAYQYLVLAKSAQCGSLYLTSQFNYLTTKKRLIMMTKNTSAKIALLKQLALAPILAGAVLLFSHKVMAQNAPPAKNNTPQSVPVAANRITMAAKKVNPIVAQSETKIIPPADHDAPQSVLDEYTALLKKHNLLPHPVDFTMPRADQHQLQDLFNQMSRKQQDSQLIQFGPLLLPPNKTPPTSQQLADWRDATKYRVSIDGKRITPSELAKHKSSEFDHYDIGRLAKTNPNYDKYHFEVDLMTPPYFAKDCKQIIEDRYQIPIVKRPPLPKQTAQAGIWPGSKTIAAAKEDAPQGILNEYTDILKRYELPVKPGDQINITPHFSAVDRDRLEVLYKQMSRKQQGYQYIRFMQPFPPAGKSYATDQQLADWQDAVKYGVWIDDKRIKNIELAKYKATDFDLASVGRLTPIPVKNDKFHYQIELMTKTYYAKYRDKTLAKKDLISYIPKDQWWNK